MAVDEGEAEAPAAKRRRVCEDLDADDDIVFEVLRYAYCGTVHFPRGLFGRFGQFLAVAERLGVDLLLVDAFEVAAGVEDTVGSGKRGLLLEPGVEHWLRSLSAADLLGALREATQPDRSTLSAQDGAARIPPSTRSALLAVLSRWRPEDFSVQALTARGPSFDVLLRLHPGLVHLSVLSLAGAVVLQRSLDHSATMDDVKGALYATGMAEDAGVSLVFGGVVVEDSSTLKDLGALGKGCSLTLGMVRQALMVRYCLCRQAAVRTVTRKEGPHQGRAFLRCSGVRGSQCPFFEWTE